MAPPPPPRGKTIRLPFRAGWMALIPPAAAPLHLVIGPTPPLRTGSGAGVPVRAQRPQLQRPSHARRRRRPPIDAGGGRGNDVFIASTTTGTASSCESLRLRSAGQQPSTQAEPRPPETRSQSYSIAGAAKPPPTILREQRQGPESRLTPTAAARWRAAPAFLGAHAARQGTPCTAETGSCAPSSGTAADGTRTSSRSCSGPMDHAMWMASLAFDGARHFDGMAPDMDRHCQLVSSRLRLDARPEADHGPRGSPDARPPSPRRGEALPRPVPSSTSGRCSGRRAASSIPTLS